MQITVNGRGYTLVYTRSMEVRWGEMDALAHVNNTVYFSYLEDARLAWMQALGVPPMKSKGEGFVLAWMECHFRRAIVYPERIEVSTYAGEPGRSSLPMYQEIRSTRERDIVYAFGENRLVWSDFGAGTSRSLPEALRPRLTQRMG